MTKFRQQDALAFLRLIALLAGLLPSLANTWYLVWVLPLIFDGQASGLQWALAAHCLFFFIFAFRCNAAWYRPGSASPNVVVSTMILGSMLLLSSLVFASIAGFRYFLNQPDPPELWGHWAYLLVFFLALCTIKSVAVASISLWVLLSAGNLKEPLS